MDYLENIKFSNILNLDEYLVGDDFDSDSCYSILINQASPQKVFDYGPDLIHHEASGVHNSSTPRLPEISYHQGPHCVSNFYNLNPASNSKSSFISQKKISDLENESTSLPEATQSSYVSPNTSLDSSCSQCSDPSRAENAPGNPKESQCLDMMVIQGLSLKELEIDPHYRLEFLTEIDLNHASFMLLLPILDKKRKSFPRKNHAFRHSKISPLPSPDHQICSYSSSFNNGLFGINMDSDKVNISSNLGSKSSQNLKKILMDHQELLFEVKSHPNSFQKQSKAESYEKERHFEFSIQELSLKSKTPLNEITKISLDEIDSPFINNLDNKVSLFPASSPSPQLKTNSLINISKCIDTISKPKIDGSEKTNFLEKPNLKDVYISADNFESNINNFPSEMALNTKKPLQNEGKASFFSRKFGGKFFKLANESEIKIGKRFDSPKTAFDPQTSDFKLETHELLDRRRVEAQNSTLYFKLHKRPNSNSTVVYDRNAESNKSLLLYPDFDERNNNRNSDPPSSEIRTAIPSLVMENEFFFKSQEDLTSHMSDYSGDEDNCSSDYEYSHDGYTSYQSSINSDDNSKDFLLNKNHISVLNKLKSILENLLDAWDLDIESSENVEIIKFMKKRVWNVPKRKSFGHELISKKKSDEMFVKVATELIETEIIYNNVLREIIKVKKYKFINSL
ncbi:hypothetical protein AYI68_g844 [Smittium mucronatum]|uniref:Uncharacterized protein n=1 Tax=Smittium mucronatum TaxID=133383 RepID=A0A1R0H769_9FUNG|nr:hypothetical protein AYI68_g844 [Smittium mucronatum]